jgi:Spy/CpxP family protein refolding chaperone
MTVMFNRLPLKGTVMKTWIKRTLFGVAGATIALGGLAACGHRMHHGDWGANATPEQAAQWRGKMVDRVASKLDLNAEQKAKLTVLGDKLHAQRLAVRGSADPRAEVKSLVAGAQFDRAKAQALVQQKADTVKAGSPEVIAALGDFYDSLNAAQQQKVRDFMEHGRGGRRG